MKMGGGVRNVIEIFLALLSDDEDLRCLRVIASMGFEEGGTNLLQ
jgi:hypothetical protein